MECVCSLQSTCVEIPTPIVMVLEGRSFGRWFSSVQSLSRVWLLATPWTTAHQALRPWDFPGKSTGVGCHCLLQVLTIQCANSYDQPNSCKQERLEKDNEWNPWVWNTLGWEGVTQKKWVPIGWWNSRCKVLEARQVRIGQRAQRCGEKSKKWTHRGR